MKRKNFVFKGLFLCCMVLCIILGMVACGSGSNLKGMSLSDFEKMVSKEDGWSYKDYTDQAAVSKKGIKAVGQAFHKKTGTSVDFYVFETADQAKDGFDLLVKPLKDSKAKKLKVVTDEPSLWEAKEGDVIYKVMLDKYKFAYGIFLH